MAAFKDKKNGTWYVQFRYTDWTGERQQKLKRGFGTKREAQEWEREFLRTKRADPDMSFESFDDPEPTPLQRFFLSHRELKVTEFAKRAGINQNLLFDYINGFKRPSREREQYILEQIHSLGNTYLNTSF